jgi:hypothetical protein
MPQMERAQQQVAAHDPSFYSGTKHLSKFTIASFSDDMIISRAAKLGVSLGNSSVQINESISCLKECDLSRTLTMLKRKEDETKESLEDQSSFILQEVSKLSEDLVDENVQISEEHKAPLVLPKKPIKVNKRKPKEVKIASRRSERIKKRLL